MCWGSFSENKTKTEVVPQHWNFAPQTLKTLQKTANVFSNLDFLQKSWFPKTRDLFMGFPWIFHGGRRPTKNVGGCGGGGSPPHEEANGPGGTKRRMHLTVPSGQKPKNLLLKHVWMVLGSGGEAGKSYESVCVKFEIFGHENSQENHKNHFRVFNTSNSSPILLFCPRNPKSFLFFEIQKDVRRKMDRNPSCQKLIWSHMVPFGVNSDPVLQPKN